MNEEKYWLDSQTVQGTLMQIAPVVVLVLKAFHVNLGPDDVQAAIVAIAALVSAIGMVVALVGRFKANTSLTFEK